MDAIKLMVDEHKNIKRMLAVIRKACYGVLKGNEIDYDDFADMIDFVRNYADKHHHGKEEKMLFTRMVDEIGGAAEKLVRHGMLVEHDLGRLFMQDLEEALLRVKEGDEESKVDVIANAVSYAHLLTRHIHKEDNVAYPYAERGLSKESLDMLNKECDMFEEEMKNLKIQDKYAALICRLEKKYIG